MQGYFWTHTVWYLLLLAGTAAAAAVAVAKAGNRRFIIAFMLAATGLFYLFEYVLVLLAGAYSYSPKIFPGNPFLDTYMGNVFSQTSIAAACALLISLRLKLVWYFAVAAAFYLIELLFTWLGIFEPHWYRTIFTPIILVPLLWAMRKWHDRAASSDRKIDGILLTFLGALAASGTTVMLPLRATEIHLFTGGFLENASRDHTATVTIYMVYFIGVLMGVRRSKLHWAWKGCLLGAVFLAQWAAWKGGLMAFRPGWFAWATAAEIAADYGWVSLQGWLVQSRLRPGNVQ